MLNGAAGIDSKDIFNNPTGKLNFATSFGFTMLQFYIVFFLLVLEVFLLVCLLFPLPAFLVNGVLALLSKLVFSVFVQF
jgi:hypothetical protein